MTKYCVRHVRLDEVLTHHGFMPRERQTKRGVLTDDKGAITFYSEQDARLHLKALGMDFAGHSIVQYEEKPDGPEEGGVKPLPIDEHHEWQRP